MEAIDLIYQRKSIRQYKDLQVPRDAIMQCLDAAIHAPSAKNQQTWHFVVIESKEKIKRMAEIVGESHEHIAKLATTEKEQQQFLRFKKYYTLFDRAPVVILVYSKPYDMIEEKILTSSGAPKEIIDALVSAQSGAQGIGAAVENFMLMATALGYGTCYMTGPTHAKKEIEELIGLEKEEYTLMSLIAMGVPADETAPKPPRKPLEEVVTFLE